MQVSGWNRRVEDQAIHSLRLTYLEEKETGRGGLVIN